MGYYTKSKYRGDYYFRPMKGDWYGARGDLWDDITGAIGQGADFVKGAWQNIFPPQLGGTKALPPPELNQVSIVGSPGGTMATPAPFASAMGRTTISGPRAATAVVPMGSDGSPGPNYHWRQPYMVGGAWVGPRHMNPLNPRALKRALRRAGRFRQLAGKVLKLTGEKRHVKGFKGLTSSGYKHKRKSRKVA